MMSLLCGGYLVRGDTGLIAKARCFGARLWPLPAFQLEPVKNGRTRQLAGKAHRLVKAAWSLNVAVFLKVVGARRFELPTYGTQNRRATRLRYAPTGR
jgi:hypothetical protein